MRNYVDKDNTNAQLEHERANALIKYYYEYTNNVILDSDADENDIVNAAKGFLDKSSFFTKETKEIPKDLQLTLLVDTANPPLSNTLHVKIFGKFCTEYIISNYKIVFAMKNLRIAVMRTVAFRTCDADWFSSSDDDDIHAISMIRRYEIAKEVSQSVSPKNESAIINLSKLISAENVIECKYYANIVAVWSKMFSKKLYNQMYFLPSPCGGEDYVFMKKLIPQLDDPTLRNIQYTAEGLLRTGESCENASPFYIWFPSNRNTLSKELQNEIVKLHNKRSARAIAGSITPREIQAKPYAHNDIVYHEDEVVGVNIFDNMHQDIYQQYVFITLHPNRKVHIEDNEIVYDGKSAEQTVRKPSVKWPTSLFTQDIITTPNWIRPRMSIDYYNTHLRDTPYILCL